MLGVVYCFIVLPVILGWVKVSIHGASLYELLYLVVHFPFILLLKTLGVTFSSEYQGHIVVILMGFIFYFVVALLLYRHSKK